MRNDVTLHTLSKTFLKRSRWDNVEATFSQVGDQQIVTIFKTKREIEHIQNFNLVPGSVISTGTEHYKILTINYLAQRPKYAVCHIEKTFDINTALNSLCIKLSKERPNFLKVSVNN